MEQAAGAFAGLHGTLAQGGEGRPRTSPRRRCTLSWPIVARLLPQDEKGEAMRKEKQEKPARRVLARTLAKELSQIAGGHPVLVEGRVTLDLLSSAWAYDAA